MAERIRWWLIPGALVVLVRVVTLDSPVVPAATPRAAAAEASHRGGLVVLQEASGHRSKPVEIPHSSKALLVTLPAERIGQRAVMTIWRRHGGLREQEPWLVLQPRVRRDGTVPIAGLPAGRYDLEMVFSDGHGSPRWLANDAHVPGGVSLCAAP